MAYTNIDDPSAYFQALTYTGNGTTTNNVTNTGNSNLQPDFVWIKDRSVARDNVVTDSSRDGEVASGTNLVLTPNTEEAEASSTGFGINYATNGINFDASWNKVNGSGETYVAWQWKANGGTTASNTNGNITSTVQANTTAGFSIVTWTGDGSTSGKNVGHGLGAVPKMIISKDRDGTSNLPGWYIYHQAIGNQDHIQFTTGAKADSPTWGDTTPTSSVFSVGGEGAYIATNQNNIDYVAYCFAEKQGYSKFGSYVGNGGTSSTGNAFVYTGFKPAWVMIKLSSSSGGHWGIHDNKRNGYNNGNQRVWANRTNSESGAAIDFLSNGFRITSTAGGYGASGGTYIYMAFAENPFVTSAGIPTTAR